MLPRREEVFIFQNPLSGDIYEQTQNHCEVVREGCRHGVDPYLPGTQLLCSIYQV